VSSRPGAEADEPDLVVELRDVFCVHRSDNGDAAALQGLDLEVGRGDQVCVLGPSGAGKTTLLRVIAGLQTPSAGVVRLLGSEIGRLGPRARARIRHETIGFLDQHAESALPPELSVRRAVGLPLALRGVGRVERARRVAELLGAVGLADRGNALPDQLSGGERQRVALCAALAHRPAVLLADEPTAELDDAAATAVNELIARLGRASGATVIVVSHDPSSAASADRTAWVRGGRIVEDRRRDRPTAVVIGPDGALPIRPALLAQAGITDRAHVEAVAGGLRITPAEGSPTTPGRGAGVRLTGRARPVEWQPARVALRSLSRSRGRGARRRVVIDRLSVVIAPGRLTVVTGRSGAGKTTLLRVLAGLDVPDAGEVLIDGRDIGRLDEEAAAAWRRAGIGYLSQEPVPVGFLSAAENVRLGLALRGAQEAAAADRATDALELVGLGNRAAQRVERLSAGETQRVALARALAAAGGLLIVDEPTSRLDEANAGLVADVLSTAAAGQSQTVICATHDARVITRADEVINLDGSPGRER